MSEVIEVTFKICAEKYDSALETDLRADFMEFMKQRGFEWRSTHMSEVKDLGNGFCKWENNYNFISK